MHVLRVLCLSLAVPPDVPTRRRCVVEVYFVFELQRGKEEKDNPCILLDLAGRARRLDQRRGGDRRRRRRRRRRRLPGRRRARPGVSLLPG